MPAWVVLLSFYSYGSEPERTYHPDTSIEDVVTECKALMMAWLSIGTPMVRLGLGSCPSHGHSLSSLHPLGRH